MAATALDVLTATVKAPVTIPASPGRAANTTDGDLAPNNGASTLIMNNTGGSAYDVLVYYKDKFDSTQDITPLTFNIAATTIRYVKLGDPSKFGAQTLVKAANVAVKLGVIQ